MRVARIRPVFVFKRTSGSEQRRIFAGPLLPGVLVRPGRLPVMPVPAGLRLQAVHADDAADAFRRLLLSDATDAFNVAADPVIDTATLGRLLRTRPVSVPPAAVRAVLAGARRLRLVRSDEELLRLLLSLPTMDASRAHKELDRRPTAHGTRILRSPTRRLAGLARAIDKRLLYVKTRFRHERRRLPRPDRAG
jgi:UDP-glucose 4-epimerase